MIFVETKNGSKYLSDKSNKNVLFRTESLAPLSMLQNVQFYDCKLLLYHCTVSNF